MREISVLVFIFTIYVNVLGLNGNGIFPVLKSPLSGTAYPADQVNYYDMIFYQNGNYLYDQVKIYQENSPCCPLVAGLEFFLNGVSKVTYGQKSANAVTIPLNDNSKITKFTTNAGGALDALGFYLNNSPTQIKIGGSGGNANTIFPLTANNIPAYRIVGFYGNKFKNNQGFNNLFANFGFYYQMIQAPVITTPALPQIPASFLKSVLFGENHSVDKVDHHDMIFKLSHNYIYDQVKIYSEISPSKIILVSGFEFFLNGVSKRLFGQQSATFVTIPLNDNSEITKLAIGAGGALDSVIFTLKNNPNPIKIGGPGGRVKDAFPLTPNNNPPYKIVGFYAKTFKNDPNYAKNFAEFGFYYEAIPVTVPPPPQVLKSKLFGESYPVSNVIYYEMPFIQDNVYIYDQVRIYQDVSKGFVLISGLEFFLGGVSKATFGFKSSSFQTYPLNEKSDISKMILGIGSALDSIALCINNNCVKTGGNGGSITTVFPLTANNAANHRITGFYGNAFKNDGTFGKNFANFGFLYKVVHDPINSTPVPVSIFKSREFGTSNANGQAIGPVIFKSGDAYIYDSINVFSENNLVSGLEFLSKGVSKVILGKKTSTVLSIPLNDNSVITDLMVATDAAVNSITFCINHATSCKKIGGPGGVIKNIFPLSPNNVPPFEIVGFYGTNSKVDQSFITFGFLYKASKTEKPNPCITNASPCGYGAICTNNNGVAVCSCPPGKTGNPKERCCGAAMSCGCWGDPHCHTFDKATYNFQGRCTYTFISTDCHNTTLPKGLVPFHVYSKQEGRAGRSPAVSFVNSLSIEIHGDKYDLIKQTGARVPAFKINNILKNPPFNDAAHGITITTAGSKILFNTGFGLSIKWDGISSEPNWDLTLCDSYKTHVCGLCGNYDGKEPNDFSDRLNNLVPLIGDSNTKYFKFGSQWKLNGDPDKDIDGSVCTRPNPNPPGPIPPVLCKNSPTYKSNSWCGAVSNPSGPWAECLKKMNPTFVSSFMVACEFDMCGLESNATEQNAFKCSHYAEFNSKCLDLGVSLGLSNLGGNWRTALNCPLTCGANEVYEVRNACPKTCLHPDGKYDCGITKPIETCYCKDGFFRDESFNCVSSCTQCKAPDGSTLVSVGKPIISRDCSKKYTCEKAGSIATVTNLEPCSPNAQCAGDANNQPICVCNKGFTGNGFDCKPVDFKEKCTVPNYCFGYGDPHYRTFDNYTFNIENECSYILYKSNGKVPFKVIVDHQFVEGTDNKASHIKKIRIIYNDEDYEISKIFKIHNIISPLPHIVDKENVMIFKDNRYIVFDSPEFNIRFDGVQFLKLRNCETATVSGICGNSNKNPADDANISLSIVADESKKCFATGLVIPK